MYNLMILNLIMLKLFQESEKIQTKNYVLF